METGSIAGQTRPAIKPISQPYSPSWVDRLTDWVYHLPAPPWLVYLSLWLLLVVLVTSSTWLDQVQQFGELSLIYVFYTFYGVYFLAAINYLDVWAKTAFKTFRSTLAVDEAEQTLLFYQLTTMPAKTVRILSATTLVCLIALIRPVIFPLWESMGFRHNSVISMGVDLGIFYFNALIVVVFVYHTIRQLRWISRIHSSATHVNLFQLRPLYALSGLTARTAGALLIVGYIIEQQSRSHIKYTSNAYALQVSELFPVLSLVMYSLLAVAAFFFPLLGLHQLLLKEKERLQAEADSRLQAHVLELHRRIDSHQLQDADSINYHLSSLALERDILAKLPTWPWQPGTLNLILSAVLLPILLWILQQILERWIGI